MLLDTDGLLNEYDNKVLPFIRNGILIDTSVLDLIINGLIKTRLSKQQSRELEEILDFLNLLKVNNNWNRFYITPHILTEVGNHLRNRYSKDPKFNGIVTEVLPILKEINEKGDISKNEILNYINTHDPVVEVGDISICLAADIFTNRNEKISILANDRGLISKYYTHPHVMVMDYRAILTNLL